MTNSKILKNALIGERLYRLSKAERKEVIDELLQTHTQRGLAKELGIPKSTIQDWTSLRQENSGENPHVSFALIYRKLEKANPEQITDWGRIEMIRDRCEELLRKRK